MAKFQQSYSFSNGEIEEREGELFITEINKEEVSVFNLSETLRKFIGTSGVKLSIKTEDTLDSGVID